MAAYSDAVKQSFFHKIVCGGTADSQNVLYLIYGISAFFIANSTLLIYAVQCRDFSSNMVCLLIERKASSWCLHFFRDMDVQADLQSFINGAHFLSGYFPNVG